MTDDELFDEVSRERDALAETVLDLRREADECAAEALFQQQRVERALALLGPWCGSTRRDGHDCAKELLAALAGPLDDATGHRGRCGQ